MHMVYFHVLIATFMKHKHQFHGVLSVQYGLLHNCPHARALPNNHIPTQLLMLNAYGVLSRSHCHIHEALASIPWSRLHPVWPSTQLPSCEGMPNNHIPTQLLMLNAYGVLSHYHCHIHEALASIPWSRLHPIWPSTQLPSCEGIAK